MQNNSVVVFDKEHKEVRLFPVGFFIDKKDSVLELPEKIRAKGKKQSTYGDVLFYEGRNFELGLSGEYQDFTAAFNQYYEGAKIDHPGCCLKVAFYFLYGYGCGFKSKALFEVYLHKAVLLGSDTAKLFEYRWNSIEREKFFDNGCLCSFPMQAC